MITYFYWWYLEEPRYLWKALAIVTKKIFYSFSVPLLLRTLFDPWKRDISYAENAPAQTLFQIWLNNLISRLVGFVVRIITVFTGILITFLFFFLAIAFLIFWLMLPVVIIYLLIVGMRSFNGR